MASRDGSHLCHPMSGRTGIRDAEYCMQCPPRRSLWTDLRHVVCVEATYASGTVLFWTTNLSSNPLLTVRSHGDIWAICGCSGNSICTPSKVSHRLPAPWACICMLLLPRLCSYIMWWFARRLYHDTCDETVGVFHHYLRHIMARRTERRMEVYSWFGLCFSTRELQ